MFRRPSFVICNNNGFELLSVAEPDLLQDDPTRIVMRPIFGAIAEYEKTMIVLKLRGARLRMRSKTGWSEGAKPYGYYEGEPAIIGLMKALSSWAEICRSVESSRLSQCRFRTAKRVFDQSTQPGHSGQTDPILPQLDNAPLRCPIKHTYPVMFWN